MAKPEISKKFFHALSVCKKTGLKITLHRKAILKILTDEHGPFTAEEILKKMRTKACDLVTIYRNLTNLESAGVLKRCDFGDGLARYEISHDERHHHHHIICTSCKRIEPLEHCPLEGLNDAAKKKGFSNVSHALEFFGLCKKCG